MTVREQTQQREEQSLSSKAVLSRRTKGRERRKRKKIRSVPVSERPGPYHPLQVLPAADA